MAQKISQGDIFGRVGTGFGQGLAEQLPKEIEHSRLRTGLKNLADQADQGNISNTQFLAQAAGTYGATPQMVQSLGELARQGNLASAYQRASGTPQRGLDPAASATPSQDFRNMQFGLQGQQPTNQPQQQQQQPSPVRDEERGQPQIVNVNPLAPEAQPRIPWTPQERNKKISEYNSMGFTPQQSQQLATDDESRYLGEPEAYKKQQENLTQIQKDARTALSRHLETKLQKTGENVFQDVSGPALIRLERGMERDLRLHPDSSVEDVANDWSNRALNMARAQDKLKKLGATTGIESLWKGDEVLKKLSDYQSIFDKADNLHDFNAMLISDMNLSPQGAASVSYPLQKQSNNYVNSYKPTSRDPERAAAIEIGDKISDKDSILSIAKALKDKDPSFREHEFFNQLREDKDRIGLNPRQYLELAEGEAGLVKSWGDILILPSIRRVRGELY